jgi:hypothetical protein
MGQDVGTTSTSTDVHWSCWDETIPQGCCAHSDRLGDLDIAVAVGSIGRADAPAYAMRPSRRRPNVRVDGNAEGVRAYSRSDCTSHATWSDFNGRGRSGMDKRASGVPRMKPLPMAQFTYEDIAIWVEVSSRFQSLSPPWLSGGSIVADRRDAELMLTLTRARNGLKSLRAAAQDMYDSLTPKERAAMKRIFGTGRPE